MKLHTDAIPFLLVGIFLVNAFGCKVELENPSVTFIFEEVPENYTSGSELPGVFRFTVDEGETIDIININSGDSEYIPKYIRPTVNYDSNCIHFFLDENKTLKDYRNEAWTPSLEYQFILNCSNVSPTNTYTYMLGIKDDNLYHPEFSSPLHKAKLQFSHVHGYQIFQGDVIVSDRDFNRNNTNFTVSCEGPDCSYFNFKTDYIIQINNDISRNSHMYNIVVKINGDNLKQLNSVLENERIMTLNLTVTDPHHENPKVSSEQQAQFELVVSKIDEPSNDGQEISGGGYLVYIIAGSILLAILVSCTGAVTYFALRSRKAKNLLRQLTEAEIREFLEGNASIGTMQRTSAVDVNTPVMALPYNHAFEIQREKLRIDETTILGKGAFGIVWKGSVTYSNGDGITVAIKTVQRNVGILYFKALLSELKIMAYIGKHPNIVSLVGACTHNIRKREVYIALQYCANGNFHNYLKCRRDRFSNLVLDGKLQLTNSATHSYIYSNKGCFSKSISTMDLIKWATQIANGLQYLESLGVIHGDLATRNVLLDSERMAKIADFGLSRRLIDYSNHYYTRTSETPLPWKWMAPESLKDMRFSKKSDIWSFGMVLWEVFTLGQTPYPGLNWDETYVERLDKGMRPTKPAFAPTLIYDIMVDCWNLDPHDRPAILDIKRAFENITSSVLRQRNDRGYMKFANEKSILRMMNEDEEGYLKPNDQPDQNYYINPNDKNYNINPDDKNYNINSDDKNYNINPEKNYYINP